MSITREPTYKPTISPTTFIPSPWPLVTGSVVSIRLNKIVYFPLSDEEIETIESHIQDSYIITEDEIFTQVHYVISATILTSETLDEKNMNPEELEDDIESAIANSLGIHIRDVEVTIAGSGYHCEIWAESYDASEFLLEALSNLMPEISKDIEDVTITELQPLNSVFVEISVTADLSNSENYDESANENLRIEFEREGYTTTIESNCIIAMKTNF